MVFDFGILHLASCMTSANAMIFLMTQGYRCRRELMQDTRHLCTAVLQTHGPASALYRDACALRMRLWAGMAEREADLTAAELALDTHDSSLCLAALTDLHETAQDLAAAVVPPGLQAGPVSH